MTDSLRLSALLPCPPDRVWRAWLSSDGHAAMTGANAEVEPREGGAFTAWDGYITGTTVAIEPVSRILQRWRTSDFPDDAPDSLLEVLLEAAPEGTRVTLVHTGIPAGQGPNYEQGWEDFYFAPMREWAAS